MRRIVGAGLVAIVVAVPAALIGRAIQYSGEAKPGVHVLNLDVGGKSRAQIVELVRAWGDQRVTIGDGTRTSTVPRRWLVSVDAAATAARALAAGSSFALVRAKHVDVAPVFGRAVSANGVLTDLARAERSPVSATLRLDGTSPVVTAGRNGRRLDRGELLRLLEQDTTRVRAPFVVVPPAVRTASVEASAARLRTLLGRPVPIDFHGARLGSLLPAQLARATRIVKQKHAYLADLDGEQLARIVRPRLGRWLVHAHNARFVVDGRAVRVVPGRPGRDVDPARLAAVVTGAALEGGAAQVELAPRAPALTTARANALGITTKLASYTTEMGVSSANRIHNVHLMADFIDGTLIEPGQVFSFNDVVGPRTADRGFLEGQEIIGSLVLPSIGGGVCQTATTLFNDAFETGLPILARVNHNLYLSHYPLGRDATVAWGGPDFQFRNDLKHGILIKASYTDQTLTFTLYGTPEGRRVVAHTGPKVRWRTPGMNYAVDPNAPKGSVKVVAGSGELGFDVSVSRDVYDSNGKLLRHDVFKSHYIPDSPTTVYGPGKTPPGPYIVLPTSI